MTNPFLADTDRLLVAIRGKRCGYLQIAPALETTNYAALPDELMIAAKAWAGRLESLGAHRVYWITLSEVVQHLHIHLYPRWNDEELKGLPLFERRESDPQPEWTDEARTALNEWAEQFSVHLIEPN